MDKIFVSSIKDNEKIDSVFLVKTKTVQTGKTGKPYIFLKLSDMTGDIKGNVWDNVQKYINLFEEGDLVHIKSRSLMFQNEPQLNISEIRKVQVPPFELNFFLKTTKFNAEDMFTELSSILRKNIDDKYVKELVELFLHDTEYVSKLKILPAAKSIHHAYIGGLLEHTLSMAKAGLLLSKHYESIVNKDIILAGILLHDVGKLEEIKFEKNIAKYSDKGRLIGHIVLGVNLIDKKIDMIKDFPNELRVMILHVVLAHHGELEFGSPKKPKTVEALLLHFIDNMDAKINQFAAITGGQNSVWSSYSKQLDRYILNTKIFMSKTGDNDNVNKTENNDMEAEENGIPKETGELF